LEDIDHLFDKGGVTGGVFSSNGGRTIRRREAPDADTGVTDAAGFAEKPSEFKEASMASEKI
jgi:hypothetical protein